jgi:hypothetical protein
MHLHLVKLNSKLNDVENNEENYVIDANIVIKMLENSNITDLLINKYHLSLAENYDLDCDPSFYKYYIDNIELSNEKVNHFFIL